jgi:hypothetical protein
MMDARIGQLMRNGAIVHYVFLSGYDCPAVEGSLEEIESALKLHDVPAKHSTPAKPERQARPSRAYIVHIEKKFPAWDEKGGFDWPVTACDAKDAIKQARKHADECWISGAQEGPVFYRARLAGAQ